MQHIEQSASSSSSSRDMTAAATTAATAAAAPFSGPKHNTSKVANRGGVWVVKSELAKAAAEVSSANSTDTQKGGDATGIGDATGTDDTTAATTSTLSRQGSLSKLNAGAPVFVPKSSSHSPPAALHPGQPGVLSLPIPIPGSQPETTAAVDLDDQSRELSSSLPLKAEDFRAQVVQQVEFYFSDANLPTDNYLMKHIKKDPEGYVPIPVISSFRKVKQLMKNQKDQKALVAALRSSSKLVVNEDGKKVKRAEPLGELDLDEIQARTVVAENLPDDHSIQSLEKLFGTVGVVKMVRVCEPGAANSVNSSSVLKHSKNDRVVSNKLHALVEYETVEQAEKAVAELTDQRNWRSGLHVRLLLRRMYPANKHNHATKGRKHSTDDEDGLENKAEAGPSEADEGTATGTPDAEKDSGKRGIQQAGGRGRGRGGRGRGRGGGGLASVNGGMLGTSPQISCSPSIGETTAATTAVSKPPPGPRMPDGTRGFSFGRGIAKSLNHHSAATSSPAT